MIQNPILPGFNPDPSIIRVESDYYIAVSSFEWFPGVPIYHSKDLSNWNLIDYGLKTKKHIDLSSLAPSKGVWAPCLSYCENEKRFYLVYSNVFSSNPVHLAIDNFVIWADSIHGPWSEPVYLNSSGIDPSLFHDDDGRKWVINQERDIRRNREAYRSIIIQEYCPKDQKLIGSPTRLTYGATKRGYTEGAHIYKRNGWYYLTTAEGGTGYAHCVCVLRSKNVTGPYEAYNENPILTSSPLNFDMDFSGSYNLDHLINNETVIQKAGHGSLIETQTGEWYMAHLCGRPVLPQKKCILGRETSIQKMEWTEDGWLRMADGTNIAKDQTESPRLPEHLFAPLPAKCDFDDKKLDLHFNSPRNEITSDWADLTAREGHLRLRGRESIASAHQPSLIARRLTAFNATVTTKMEFAADTYQQCAGLTCYYDMYTHYSIYQTYDEEKSSNILTVSGIINGSHIECGSESVCVKANQPIYLQAQIDNDKLQFFYSEDGITFSKLAETLDMTNVSDEASQFGKFTGAFVGIFAQDMDRRTKYADFDYFQYEI